MVCQNGIPFRSGLPVRGNGMPGGGGRDRAKGARPAGGRSMAVTAVKREAVLLQLRDAITSGCYRPGQRLSERELASQLGVSRTPVREALRHLEREGLVCGPGIRVAPVSVERARQLYAVREPLELLAVRLVTERGAAADLGAIRQALEEAEDARRSQDLVRLIRANKTFHRQLAAQSGNGFLEDTLASLQAHVGLLMATSLSLPDRPVQTLREHWAIYERVQAGDREGALHACRQHLENALQAAVRHLEQQTRAAGLAVDWWGTSGDRTDRSKGR